MRRDMSFFDEQQSGRIVSRVTSDTEEFANVVTLTLSLASQVLLVVFVAAFLFYRNWQLALIALTIAPVIMGVALAFRKIARSTSTGAQRAMANVNKTIQETMRGIAVAKNFRQEAQVYQEFGEVNQQAYAVTLRQGYIYSGIFPILFIVSGMGTVAILYFGGQMVVDREDQRRRLVSLPSGHCALLAAVDQHRVVLEPVSAGTFRIRAGLRSHRRAAARHPDCRRRADRFHRRDRVQECRLRLCRGSTGAARFLVAYRTGRDDRAGGAYRRGQIDPWQADRPVL